MTSGTLLAAPPYLLNSVAIESPDIKAWQTATIQPAMPDAERHSIHSYFNTCPESPDGRHIVFFASTAQDAHSGEIRIIDRITGEERLLARSVTTEDAHRAACQQWLANGRKVLFHDLRDGHWLVLAVDVETGAERVLARNRQLGFGSQNSVWTPLYGCHWKPGEHRDLELVNVDTGETRTAIAMKDVLRDHGAKVTEMVGEGQTSVFFPVMSPDGNRAFLKIARGSGTDDFRSSRASVREGKFVVDLTRGTIIRVFTKWGHPSWSPDSSGIFEKGNILVDVLTGKARRCSPGAPSNHPCMSPDGEVFATDADISRREDGKPGEWGIIVGLVDGDEFATIRRFDNTGGARSWRRSHPHPVFSADGKRIYFNVSEGTWTRLWVAERSEYEEAARHR